MTGTELVNILKSPTSKIVIFGVLLIAGALLLIPLLNRNDKTSSIQENTELKQEEKAPIEIGSGIPQFKAEAEGNKTVSKASPPPPAVISRNSEKSKTPIYARVIPPVKSIPKIISGIDRYEPIFVTGIIAARKRMGKYPLAYCTACPASCAATPIAETLSLEYTLSESRIVFVRGS